METDSLLGNSSADNTQHPANTCECSQSSDSPSIQATVNGRGTPVAVTSQYNSINRGCRQCQFVIPRRGSTPVPDNVPNVDYQSLLESVAAAPPVVPLKVYKRRWWVLLVFSVLAMVQGGLCNVWTVIAESAEAAFGWSSNEVALMQGWLYIAFLVMMFPASLLMDVKGIRLAMLVSAFLVVIGTILRCITATPPYVTWFAHAGQVFNGLASPVMYTAGPVISALWFPPEQRATATAIATVAGFAGNAACFLIGPLLIREPVKIDRPHLSSTFNTTVITEIKQDILHCRYGECALCVILFLAILAYFPSKPPKPPSLTAAIVKVDFRHGFIDLFRRENANFWLMALPYTFIISIYSVWTALFDVNLKHFNVDERMAGWLGFYGVAAGCIAAVIVGRIADVMVGRMKMLILCMNAGAIVVTFVFLLITAKFIPYTPAGLYVCCVLQGIFCNGSIPLFYELSIEATYPVAEVATSAVLNILYNVLPLFFLAIFLIPNLTTEWMNWVMYGSLLLAFPMLLCFQEEYRRLRVDQVGGVADSDISSSGEEGEGVSQRSVQA